MRRSLLLAVSVVTLLFAAGIAFIPRGRAGQSLQGTVLTPVPAPGIAMRDQRGRTVRLLTPSTVPRIVTFIHAQCTESCPVIAETIRRVTVEMRHEGVRVPVIAISTDPEGDTPRAVAAFFRLHHLTANWHYITGPRSALTPVWNRFHIYVPPAGAPPALRDGHTSATFVLDAGGEERVLLGGVPDARFLLYDLRLLAGLPTNTAARGVVAEQGAFAPLVTMRSLSGHTLDVTRERGKVVLLNFWATWCPPCRQELPLLSQLAQRYGKQGLVVVGVDKLEDPATVRRFTARMRLRYPVVVDDSGTIWGAYQPLAVPQSYVIGRDGTIRAVHTGTISRGWVTKVLLPALQKD